MSENESTVSEMAKFNESAVMSSLEVHSTPNVGQDDKTMSKSSTDETNITEDSGIQLTPTSTKCNKLDDDIMSILRTISMDIHEQKNEIKEIKVVSVRNKMNKTCLLYTSRCV